MFFRTGMCLSNFNALQAVTGRQTAILNKNSDDSFICPRTEKTSRCASYRSSGSLTVEAAMVFPVFLFALTAFLYLIFLLQLQTEIGRALTDTGRWLSQTGYISENTGSLAPSALAALYGRIKVEEYLEDRAAEELIQGGAENISFLGTVWNEDTSMITLRASFQAVFPPGWTWFHPVRITQVRTVRGFTGFSGRGGSLDTESSQIVYITDQGRVYHRDLNCRYLNLSIQQTEFNKVENLRNKDGGKYYPCERCWEDGSAVIFFTESGSRYHQSLNCSSLIRGIHAVHLWETGGRPPCSVCGG